MQHGSRKQAKQACLLVARTHLRPYTLSSITRFRRSLTVAHIDLRRCSCSGALARESRLLTPLPVVPCSSESPRPVPCPESPVLVPACTCLPPLIPFPPSLPDPEQGPSTALIGSRREANWMRPCMAASLIFMSSCQSHPPRTEQRSMAVCALPCGEARKLRRWATRSLLFVDTPEP